MPEEDRRRFLSAALSETGLSSDVQEILRECYLQHNRVDSCALKTRMSNEEIQVWYMRLSIWCCSLELGWGMSRFPIQ